MNDIPAVPVTAEALPTPKRVRKAPPARKPARKASPPARGVAKGQPPKAVKAVKAVKAGKPGKVPATEAVKPEKVKLVRDSFTIPAAEYELLAVLKQRALQQAHPAKKSELLRAGIQVLAALGDAALLAALQAVPSIKTGRPKGRKGD